MDLLSEDFAHHDGLLDPSLEPINPNGHHQQLISAQTGLPVLNPNNPPLPTPSVSGTGSSGPTMEVIRISHQDSHPPPYPMGAIPYGSHFGPPFMHASFNPLPVTMYPQVIYQASLVMFYIIAFTSVYHHFESHKTH